VSTARWIELDGAVNVRDLGGRSTIDGRQTRSNRLIRSDNLQALSPADVRRLVDEYGVRTVVDLRSGIEVTGEGPGPLTRESLVHVANLSLYPEVGRTTDVAATDDDDAPVLLPWQTATRSYGRQRGAVAVYVGYLEARPDSILAALRLIASSDGATVVHCAAGKDRTGLVIALTLEELAVNRADVVADYADSGERIEAIFARLSGSTTYAEDVAGWDLDKHRPRAETMAEVLDAIDTRFGGAPAWLRSHGWTDEDAAALRRQLLN
jgi:protein-tyrosine phosphatase